MSSNTITKADLASTAQPHINAIAEALFELEDDVGKEACEALHEALSAAQDALSDLTDDGIETQSGGGKTDPPADE